MTHLKHLPERFAGVRKAQRLYASQVRTARQTLLRGGPVHQRKVLKPKVAKSPKADKSAKPTA